MQKIRRNEKVIMSHYLAGKKLEKATLEELRSASTKIRKRIKDIDRDIYDRIEHTDQKEDIPLEEERYILASIDGVIYDEIQNRKGKKTNCWVSELVFHGKG